MHHGAAKITRRAPLTRAIVALLFLVSIGRLAALAEGAAADYDVSLAAGERDAAGRFMGGTELRVLAAHAGRLYAGNGYWEDRPGDEGPQGAAILVLDGPKAAWRVEHVFDERLPSGRGRDLAVSALRSVVFATDGKGATLSKPAAMLIASTWDLTGASRVFSRDEATGLWTATTLSQDRTSADFVPQIRSFGVHRDQRTGIDHVFAGHTPRGIFSGAYDAAVPGHIRWGSVPELDLSGDSGAAFSGLGGRLRVNAFADSNGVLYAAVGQQIYQRVDGAEPSWRLFYTNPRPGRSETGLRGLTAVPDPSGKGEVLLAAVEGTTARIVRIDPATGRDATDLDLRDFLVDAWRVQVDYIIAAYNDMATIRDGSGRERLVIGLEAFIPPRAQMPVGHLSVSVGYGRLDGGAWYLVRSAAGHYELHQINATLPTIGAALVATRAILASPFPGDGDTVYFAGYDANKAAAHNTAWIVRTKATAISGR
jgi:hypothetical protein